MAHSAQFLKLVNEAKKKIKETNVAEVKRRTDAGEKFLLVDVPCTWAAASSNAISSSVSQTRTRSSSCIAAADFAPRWWPRICKRWATTTSNRWTAAGGAGWKRVFRSPGISGVRLSTRSKQTGLSLQVSSRVLVDRVLSPVIPNTYKTVLRMEWAPFKRLTAATDRQSSFSNDCLDLK